MYLLLKKQVRFFRWCVVAMLAAMLAIPGAVSASVVSDSSRIIAECSSATITECPSAIMADNGASYRSNSLCIIFLTHKNKKYAQAMEEVFMNFPLPESYNDKNVYDIRVISVEGKQTKEDIDNIISGNDVARKIVAGWFNSSGTSYGSPLPGEMEQLQSTFVLVCDMDYIDKRKRAMWASLGLTALSVTADVVSIAKDGQAHHAAHHGNFGKAFGKMDASTAWEAGSAFSELGAVIASEIGGFRVKMNAYLYKLCMNSAQGQASGRDNYTFNLQYLGKYKANSSKTTLGRWKNGYEVILDVCERCVNSGLQKLADEFPVFRPRVPLHVYNGNIYSRIGVADGVICGKKYEVLQPYKDADGQIDYRRVGIATAGTPWNNADTSSYQSQAAAVRGTIFYCDNLSVDVNTPGLQLREL